MITSDLISVITPSYNVEKYISHAIESVLNQSYKKWELIIVDDNSSDDTVKIIQKYLKIDKRIKLIQLEKNMGAGYCRNLAIKNAIGQFHSFLDSDDLWHEKKLEVQVNFMISNNIAFSFMSYDFINERGEKLNIEPIVVKEKVSYLDMIKTNSIGCLTAMYDLKLLDNSKIYMSEIRLRQDLSLWLKILKKIDYAYPIDNIQSSYRIRKKSISSNKIKVIYYQWKLYRKVEDMSFIKSLYFLVFYIYYGLLKYIKKNIL